jgi:cobalt-zinc-cadmium efflux system membrane fusion protein
MSHRQQVFSGRQASRMFISNRAPYFVVRAALFLAGLALLVFGAACGRAAHSVGRSTYYESGAYGAKPELFTIPQDQMAHVQIVTVQPTTLTRTLRLTGAVAFNGFDTTPVITQVSGRVTRIVATPGQKVRRGEPLLYIASPDYSQLLSAYLKAKDSYHLADLNYARSKDLYDHHAMAERDLQAAESARTQAQADLGSSEQALRVVGINKPESMVGKPVSAEVPITAPIAGEAVERLVAPGQVIQAGTTQVFTISNMNSVWVLANVYQKDLPYVRIGDVTTVTTDAYPGEVFRGKISYVAAALDPNTRTLQARIDVANPHEKLKKDMYVVAEVKAGTVPNALAVPSAAVLRDSENQPFVYTLTGNNQFARRPVTIGESTEGKIRVTSGLTPGDRIVGDGSLFLQFANSLQR